MVALNFLLGLSQPAMGFFRCLRDPMLRFLPRLGLRFSLACNHRTTRYVTDASV